MWDYRHRSKKVRSFEHIRGREDDETHPLDTTKIFLVTPARVISKKPIQLKGLASAKRVQHLLIEPEGGWKA